MVLILRNANTTTVDLFLCFQVGQIIQSLAMSRCERNVDTRLDALREHLHAGVSYFLMLPAGFFWQFLHDSKPGTAILYVNFTYFLEQVMNNVISTILEGPYRENPPLVMTRESSSPGEGAPSHGGPLDGLIRDVCLVAEPHLQQLLTFLHMVRRAYAAIWSMGFIVVWYGLS